MAARARMRSCGHPSRPGRRASPSCLMAMVTAARRSIHRLVSHEAGGRTAQVPPDAGGMRTNQKRGLRPQISQISQMKDRGEERDVWVRRRRNRSEPRAFWSHPGSPFSLRLWNLWNLWMSCFSSPTRNVVVSPRIFPGRRGRLTCSPRRPMMPRAGLTRAEGERNERMPAAEAGSS